MRGGEEEGEEEWRIGGEEDRWRGGKDEEEVQRQSSACLKNPPCQAPLSLPVARVRPTPQYLDAERVHQRQGVGPGVVARHVVQRPLNPASLWHHVTRGTKKSVLSSTLTHDLPALNSRYSFSLSSTTLNTLARPHHSALGSPLFPPLLRHKNNVPRGTLQPTIEGVRRPYRGVFRLRPPIAVWIHVCERVGSSSSCRVDRRAFLGVALGLAPLLA